MRKITRKQAVSNMQCLFDDFFKTYFNAPKEAIEETIENATFGEQKERLRKAVYSTEYNTILGQLDSESFRKYYEKVGEFAKAYNIDTKLFTEETPAVIEDINDVLGESTNITEKLDLINGFTDAELRTDRISFGTKTALIESILDCWFVGDDKEQGINRMLMSLTADDRLAFVNKIGTDRKFLNRLFQSVNGGEKDEMLAILGEIFISTGFTDGKDSISLNNDGNDRVTGSFEREKIIINITKVQAYGMRARATNRKIEASPLDIITMNYDGMIIRVPAFLLLNSWSNTFATQEGIFFNYKYEDIDWNSLDERQKDEYFSEFVSHYSGKAVFDEIVGNPFGFALSVIIGILVAKAGAVAASIAALTGAGFSAVNLMQGWEMMQEALKSKQEAGSIHELKQAAKEFSQAVAKMGVNAFLLIVSMVELGVSTVKGVKNWLNNRKKISVKPPYTNNARKDLNSIFKNGVVKIKDLEENPNVFNGKSVEEIAQALKNEGYDVTIKASTRSRSGAQIIKISNLGDGKNISQVQVSPGGGRHGSSPYVKISTNDQGIIKIVNGPQSLYITDGNETAKIIFTGGN